ncbi:Trm112 family protein [Chromohalobacter sp. HP20-39]|uniref:Trm112 family protein n=1 Tax=Chromohalobacter sp. HP20-39 TaxID=3079306 RepID=UPI00294B6C23|nr:Trm112 family protein [Chromohalobacter sp. HP20-39]MDV6319940.1 Trm112 family protein [Chromohalobacter sp. HP20-39]
MDKQMLAMLVCPRCQGKLKYDRERGELKCRFDGLAFPVEDEIPVMLEEQARHMDVDEKLDKPRRSAGETWDGAS